MNPTRCLIGKSRASLATALAVALCACGGGGTDRDAAAGREAAFDVLPLSSPAGPGSAQARLTASPDGELLLSWLEPSAETEGHTLRFARREPDGWSAAVDVASSDRFFVNWADFPSVTPVTERFWVAHWLHLQEDSFGAYDAIVAVSADGGNSWSTGSPLNDDATETEHGFVDVFPADGVARAVWLDGRELARWSFDDPDQLLAVSLRVADVSPDGAVSRRGIVDDMVCDCCQPDVAMAASGPVLTYRDRTADEIRDVVVRPWRDGEWLEPRNVGSEQWFIEGCPVNGPAIDADGDAVAVAWFTAAVSPARVRLARSDDGGLSFGEAVDVDAEGALGQVDVVLGERGAAVVSWWRQSEGGGIDLAVRRIGPDGAPGPIRLVGHEAVSQPIDVPQLVGGEGRFTIVWSSFDDGGVIRAAEFVNP